MKHLAFTLACLLLLVPVAAADEATSDSEPESEPTPCSVFVYSLNPPGYRLDLDCLELPPSP